MLQCIISQFVSSTMTVCRRIVLIKFESLIRHRMCVLQSFGRGSLSNNLLYSTTQRIHRTSVHSAPFFDSQRNKDYLEGIEHLENGLVMYIDAKGKGE
jgi:hypothetical protein